MNFCVCKGVGIASVSCQFKFQIIIHAFWKQFETLEKQYHVLIAVYSPEVSQDNYWENSNDGIHCKRWIVEGGGVVSENNFRASTS